MATTTTPSDGIQLTIEHEGTTYRRTYHKADAHGDVIHIGRVSSTNADDSDLSMGSNKIDFSGIGGAVTTRGRAAFVSPVMSRQHARLVFSGDGMVYLSDPPNHSHHGTFITRGQDTFRVEHPQPLQEGDTITFGKTVHRGGQSYAPLAAKVHLLQDDPTSPSFLSSTSFNGRGYSLPGDFGTREEDDIDEAEDHEVYKDDEASEEPPEPPETHKFYAIEELPDDEEENDMSEPPSPEAESIPPPAHQYLSNAPTPPWHMFRPVPIPSGPQFQPLQPPQHSFHPPQPMPMPWRMFHDVPPPPPPPIPTSRWPLPHTRFQDQMPSPQRSGPVVNLFQPFGPFGSTNPDVNPFYPREPEQPAPIQESVKPSQPSYVEIIDVDASEEEREEDFDVDVFSVSDRSSEPEEEEGEDDEDDRDAEGSSDMDQSEEDEIVEVPNPKRAAAAAAAAAKHETEIENVKTVISNIKEMTNKLDKLLTERQRSKRRMTLQKIQVDAKLATIQSALTALEARVVERNQAEADIQQRKKEIIEDMEEGKHRLMSDINAYEEDVKYDVDRALDEVDDLVADTKDGRVKVEDTLQAVQTLKSEIEAAIRAEVDSIREAGLKALAQIDEVIAGTKRKRDEPNEEVPAAAEPQPEILEAPPAMAPQQEIAMPEVVDVAVLESPSKRRKIDFSTFPRRAIQVLVCGAALYYQMGRGDLE